MSRSCWRRCAPVIRTRGRPALLVMLPIVPRDALRPGVRQVPARPGGGGAGAGSGRRDPALGRPPHRVGPLHVARPPELLEDPDGPGADVDLAAKHAVPGA